MNTKREEYPEYSNKKICTSIFSRLLHYTDIFVIRMYQILRVFLQRGSQGNPEWAGQEAGAYPHL